MVTAVMLHGQQGLFFQRTTQKDKKRSYSKKNLLHSSLQGIPTANHLLRAIFSWCAPRTHFTEFCMRCTSFPLRWVITVDKTKLNTRAVSISVRSGGLYQQSRCLPTWKFSPYLSWKYLRKYLQFQPATDTWKHLARPHLPTGLLRDPGTAGCPREGSHTKPMAEFLISTAKGLKTI